MHMKNTCTTETEASTRTKDLGPGKEAERVTNCADSHLLMPPVHILDRPNHVREACTLLVQLLHLIGTAWSHGERRPHHQQLSYNSTPVLQYDQQLSYNSTPVLQYDTHS